MCDIGTGKACWDIPLTPDDIYKLTNGVSPLYINLDHLVYYEPRLPQERKDV